MYVFVKVVGGNLKLVMRKASWDPQIDEELTSRSAATLNLLYVQTVAEVERGWVRADAETKRQLARLQARGAKKEVCMQSAISGGNVSGKIRLVSEHAHEHIFKLEFLRQNTHEYEYT